MDQDHILVVDDEEVIRHSTSFMLRNAGYLVKTYSDGPLLLSALTQDPDRTCILLDVRMPDMDGLTVLKTLRKRGYNVPVIILTGHGDVSTAVDAMKAGATDFLEKPYKKAELTGAIEAAFDKLDKGEMAQSAQKTAQARLETLTARELDVLKGLANGMTNKSIATGLGISARTVEVHRANLMTKLQADNISAILKIAFAAGLGD